MSDSDSSRNPPRKDHHDLLLITPEGGYQRFASEQRGEAAGRFLSAPQTPEPGAGGTRKVLGLARQGTPDEPHGPALAILPIKPEPAGSACGICYLVNAENLNEHNPWVNAAWNDSSLAQAPDRTLHDGFEVLLAGPDGKVYHVRKAGDDGLPRITEIDLEGEGEIWSQLRNGCIAGSAEYVNHPERGARIVPLVNVASLVPVKAG